MQFGNSVLQRRGVTTRLRVRHGWNRRRQLRQLKLVAQQSIAARPLRRFPYRRKAKRLRLTCHPIVFLNAFPFDSDDYFESEDDWILPTLSTSTGNTTRGNGDTDASKSKKEGSKNQQTEQERGVFGFLHDMNEDLPKSWYHKALWLWERPVMKLGRLTVFFAQLPTVFAFLASQIGFLVGQITLPMLPPLLLGVGILLRSIWVNAGHLLPRVSLTILLLWGIWMLNSLVYRTVGYLTNQGTVKKSAAHAIMNWTEGLTMVIAGLVMLSLFGVNISGLLLPAGICIALAAKDLAHNFLAGLVLFLAQPFQVGDQVSVQSMASGTQQQKQKWYDGVCERVDLRYTVLRRGKYKLHVPNASFITKEFLVLDKSYAQINDEGDPLSSDTNIPMPSIQSTLKNAKAVDARTNGSLSESDDFPSDADYPSNELHIGDLTDLMSDI